MVEVGAQGRVEGEPLKDTANEPITRDSLMRGRVAVFQAQRGYRFSLDPVLLAGFVTMPYGRFLDLGAGTGVLGFLLLARDSASSGVSVEIQPRLATLARRGSMENGFADRLRIDEDDFLNWAPRQSNHLFDLIASNPPFYKANGGRLSPNPERALAHHEVALPLLQWTAAAVPLLSPGGRLAIVFPAEREGTLLAALHQVGLRALRLRRVRPSRGRPHHRVLVEASRATASLYEEPELVVHEGDGFADEVLRFLGESA